MNIKKLASDCGISEETATDFILAYHLHHNFTDHTKLVNMTLDLPENVMTWVTKISETLKISEEVVIIATLEKHLRRLELLESETEGKVK
jgi:hypothetical protein